jgi:cytochrome P450
MNEYFLIEIAERRITPGDDLITYLLNARIDGQPVSDDDTVGTLRLLLVAGVDTTWSMIGACLWHLATHRDDRKRLVADPGLMPTAIVEFLRAHAPATLAREIVKETQIGGCPFKEGEMALLSFPAANRDPAVFPEPNRVILDRKAAEAATGFKKEISWLVPRFTALGIGLADLLAAITEDVGQISWPRLASCTKAVNAELSAAYFAMSPTMASCRRYCTNF